MKRRSFYHLLSRTSKWRKIQEHENDISSDGCSDVIESEDESSFEPSTSTHVVPSSSQSIFSSSSQTFLVGPSSESACSFSVSPVLSVNSAAENLFSDVGDCENISVSGDIPEDTISDDETDVPHEVKKIKKFLCHWAIEENITKTALCKLCRGLRDVHNCCFSTLPTDARTITKTPAGKVPVLSVPPGDYCHIGIEFQLREAMSIANSLFTSAGLVFNIDGVPLAASSSSQLWPILMSVPNISSLQGKIFPVGIYHGLKKPSSVDQYLRPFTDEFKSLLTNGFSIHGRHISIFSIGFCCDMPARAFVMAVKGHGGFKACSRCTVPGKTLNRTRVYPETNCPKRTDESYRSHEDVEYQPFGRSTPLEEIPEINFGSGFCLDYMHLICLGVVKDLTQAWFGTRPYTLSLQARTDFSNLTSDLRLHLPVEFNQKMREMDLHSRWKASEARQFLLYIGPVAAKTYLTDTQYAHFMLLHVASLILLSPKHCSESEKRQYARQLLTHFVDKTPEVYDESFLTLLWHSLIHLPDDADYFSKFIPDFSLDSISAFPFESTLGWLKRRKRAHSRPLQQVVKRLVEIYQVKTKSHATKLEVYPKFEKSHHDGPLPLFCKGPQYKSVKFPNFMINASMIADRYCGLKSGEIVKVENIASNESNEQIIIGRYLMDRSDFYPSAFCDSTALDVCKGRKFSDMKQWLVSKVDKKYVVLPFRSDLIFFPLLHTLKSIV